MIQKFFGFLNLAGIGLPMGRAGLPTAFGVEERFHVVRVMQQIPGMDGGLVLTVMVNHLVLQDTEQPCFLRRPPLESILGFHGRQERFLNQVFGDFFFLDPGKRKMKK